MGTPTSSCSAFFNRFGEQIAYVTTDTLSAIPSPVINEPFMCWVSRKMSTVYNKSITEQSYLEALQYVGTLGFIFKPLSDRYIRYNRIIYTTTPPPPPAAGGAGAPPSNHKIIYLPPESIDGGIMDKLKEIPVYTGGLYGGLHVIAGLFLGNPVLIAGGLNVTYLAHKTSELEKENSKLKKENAAAVEREKTTELLRQSLKTSEDERETYRIFMEKQSSEQASQIAALKEIIASIETHLPNAVLEACTESLKEVGIELKGKILDELKEKVSLIQEKQTRAVDQLIVEFEKVFIDHGTKLNEDLKSAIEMIVASATQEIHSLKTTLGTHENLLREINGLLRRNIALLADDHTTVEIPE